MMPWLCHMKFRTLFYFVGSILLVIVVIQVFIQIQHEKSNDPWNHVEWTGKLSVIVDPVILWWTPFTGTKGEVKICGDVKCFFTEERKFKNLPLTKVIMFYGSGITPFDLPLPRNPLEVEWALLHEESPKNTPILLHQEMLELFNYSSTFSRHSHVPLTLQYLKNMQVITDSTYYVPTEMKDKLLSKLSPVVYVHSDCSTPLERDSYVVELMKYIPVDSYGQCVQNKKLPENLTDAMQSMGSSEFYHFLARYKFTLTFENAICEDYITEKLWRPLVVGSVPVYMGSPSIRDWLPNNNSAILVSDFKSPRELAEHLLKLNSDVTKYEKYLAHKLSASSDTKITNNFLIHQLEKRKWKIDNDYESENFIEHFECFVCKKIHEKRGMTYHSNANQNHYYCPVPLSPLTGKPNGTNWWIDVWNSSHCEAKILRQYIDNNINSFSREEFYDKLNRRFSNYEC